MILLKPSIAELEKKLKKRNITPSYQRLKILEYLTQNHSHPTVDQIFASLHKEIPTLSKTTVYNTLKKLIDEQMIRVITIGGKETRYDINTADHGHFKCEKCGMIFDFNINMNSLEAKGLYNFKISDKNVYFKGICLRCLSNK